MEFFETKEFFDHLDHLQDDNPDLLRTLLQEPATLDAYLERTVTQALELKKELKESQGFDETTASMEVSRNIIAPDMLALSGKPLTKDERNDLQEYLDKYNPFEIVEENQYA